MAAPAPEERLTVTAVALTFLLMPSFFFFSEFIFLCVDIVTISVYSFIAFRLTKCKRKEVVKPKPLIVFPSLEKI